jgi:hypothetical protein
MAHQKYQGVTASAVTPHLFGPVPSITANVCLDGGWNKRTAFGGQELRNGGNDAEFPMHLI